MPSILSGYTYDVFISYRQKDNKGEHWVTEFVNALKTELESTFKEDISIYFDENPHDGLHEHHDVDDSLREKLKCLVFIPIVSRTYCDPTSFAWVHEFKAFLDQASKDSPGLKIKLSNGNVAGRVLPIRIHDLETVDVSLFESETRAVLRPIDFVYKSSGVNRPLLPTDKREENLNHIVYRDQINKVAIALKELIAAMRAGPQAGSEKVRESSLAIPTIARPTRKRLAIFSVLVLVAVIAAYFLAPWGDVASSTKASIAIIPFRNNTGEESKSFFGVGVASEVSTRLGLTRQFEFISALQATMKYQQSEDTPEQIGRDLGVTHILTGIYQTAGDDIQVTVELIDASVGNVIWSLPYRTRYDDVFNLQANIASKVLERFSQRVAKEDIAYKPNLEAYTHFVRGQQVRFSSNHTKDWLKALPEFQKAIQLDSGFLAPWVGALEVYAYHYFNAPADTSITAKTVEPYLKYIMANFPDSWEKKNAIAAYTYWVLRDYDKAMLLFQEVLKANPEAENSLGSIYRRKLMLKEAIQREVEVLKRNPVNVAIWNVLGADYYVAGDYKHAAECKAAMYNLNPGLPFDLYDCHFNGDSLEKLPAKIKSYYGKIYTADLLLLRRNYEGLLRFMDSVRVDSTFGPRSRTAYKAVSQHLLGKDNLAEQTAKAFSQLPAENNPRLARYLTITILGLTKNENELDSFQLVEARRWGPDDLLDKFYRRNTRIYYLILAKRYKEATESLIQLNKDFPQVGDYRWINHPHCDRIKKEYPAFQQAIIGLRHPPKIELDDRRNF